MIHRNYTCRLGELDLVLRDANVLVVAEVRFRQPNRFGSALESVTPAKQRRLQLATRHFLMCHRAFNSWACRFDVVAVSKPNYAARFEWVKDAF